MNASLLAETSIRSSSVRSWAIFLSTEVIESGLLLYIYVQINKLKSLNWSWLLDRH